VSTNGRTPRRPQSRRPLYGRVLGLRHVRPTALVSFLLFECAIAVAALLALAELVSWWAVVVLPASVAAMVKLNDLVTGEMRRSLRPVAVRARVERPQRPAVATTEDIWPVAPAATFAPPRLTSVTPPPETRTRQQRGSTDSAARRYRRPGDAARRAGNGSRHAASTNEPRFGRSA
jgi:hypothetical protein